MKNKLMLIIMDGVGVREATEFNAVANAHDPNLKSYFAAKPMTTLNCHGLPVGLPEGVMGNSEVGHLNIGAGRVVMQDLVRIDLACKQHTFEAIPEFLDLVKYIQERRTPLHLFGLLSDAGVHSDMNHLKSILKILKEQGIQNVYVHAITDGRDTPPNSGINYLQDLLNYMKTVGVGKLATISGRYYFMDRDKRWDRVELAYKCITQGDGLHTTDPIKTVQEMYAQNITDEFLKPIVVDDQGAQHIFQANDAVLALNFRADRMREIVSALMFKEFDGFQRAVMPPLYLVTMTQYREDFPFPVLFKKQSMNNILGDVLAQHGLTQLRIAETEKYPHVSYFFNGGEETQFPGEDRILVPSPKEVPTYDLKPEMSAPKVTEKLIEAIQKDVYDVIMLNFANGDMVGHTGVYEAALKAIATIDGLIGQLVQLFTSKGGTVLITADHGNAEEMWDFANNQPHTQHSLNPVPFIVITPDARPMKLRHGGSLCDIAPTMLEVLNIPKPAEMTGTSLLIK